jgi:hypothetical protein
MKKSSKNSKRKEENNNPNQFNNSEMIQNMQKKIKDQAKRLMSMQEYISTLETTLRENNQSENSLRNLNINKDQATQNEFFENNNIIKNDLKECLNFLKEKLLIKEKEEKIGNEAYNEILEEILEIKKENEKNLEEKKFLEEKIEEYENSIGDLRQNMDLINKLNNENNNLYNQNVALENELNDLKNIYEENYMLKEYLFKIFSLRIEKRINLIVQDLILMWNLTEIEVVFQTLGIRKYYFQSAFLFL